MPESFFNNPSSTLQYYMDEFTTNLYVVSSSGYGSAPFRVQVDREVMIVTAISGSTFTVVRGCDGTLPTAHNSGVNVDHFITSGGLYAKNESYSSYGLSSARPSAGNTGKFYFPTDGIPSVDDGTNWKSLNVARVMPPPSSGWSFILNTASTTATHYPNGYLYIKTPASSMTGSTYFSFYGRSIKNPSKFDVTMDSVVDINSLNNSSFSLGAGMMLYNIHTGVMTFFLAQTFNVGAAINIGNWRSNNPSDFSDTYFSATAAAMRNVSFNVVNTGARTYFRYSVDKNYWVDATAQASLDAIYTHVGPAILNTASSPSMNFAGIGVYGWDESTS